MPRYALILWIMLYSVFMADGRVVVDSLTRTPLPNVSIFDRNGNFTAISGHDGRIPHIAESDYPITIRYIGFKELLVPAGAPDTLFMTEDVIELPEMVVNTRNRRMLHILAYVREYSTLSSFGDSVFLFREKMVDFMLPSDKKMKFRGWRSPRVLASKSYYRFTNYHGLDSVSDRCHHHFSWTDWMGIVQPAHIPASLTSAEFATDTVRGRRGPTEIWTKNGDRLAIDINLEEDSISEKWMPNIDYFLGTGTDFDRFSLRLNYENVIGDSILPIDLTGYSFAIESTGRGHNMFMFHRPDDPYFVSTYGEVYIIDKEYITIKEAKKWEALKQDTGIIEIYEPAQAPDLQPAIKQLISRVESIDHTEVRTGLPTDKRLVAHHIKLNPGQQILSRLKQMFGIDAIIGDKKRNKEWKNFRKKQVEHNNSR